MERTIPESAFLIKEGLYCNAYEVTMGSLTWTVWELISADGWCFYDLQDAENYDEDGNLRPANQLMYAQWMKMRANAEYVEANIISVPVQDDFNILGRPTDTEIA
jgi:hypothetical protein